MAPPTLPNRIMIIGCPGTGKSTVSEKLGQHFSYPIIFLDQHYWSDGWKGMPEPKWRTTIEKLIEPDRWIMDGNYSGTWDLRLPRAQLVIYLDYPTRIPLYRALKRILFNYGKVRKNMADGCPERFSWEFLHYILLFRIMRRKANLHKLEKYASNTPTLFFLNPQELKSWLNSLHI